MLDLYIGGFAVVAVGGFFVGLVGAAFSTDPDYGFKAAFCITACALAWPLAALGALIAAWQWVEVRNGDA